MLEFPAYTRHRPLQEAVLANATAPGQAAEDREPINNVEALEEALEDIAWPATVGWLEAQVSTTPLVLQLDSVPGRSRDVMPRALSGVCHPLCPGLHADPDPAGQRLMSHTHASRR